MALQWLLWAYSAQIQEGNGDVVGQDNAGSNTAAEVLRAGRRSNESFARAEKVSPTAPRG